MRLIILGDVHANFGALNTLVNELTHRRYPNEDLTFIACGDFGYWPAFVDFDKIKMQGHKLYFCDGNHEDHHALAQLKDNVITEGVEYIPRGTVMDFDGTSFLFMGGADSIDKQWRTPGRDWFPEEVLTQKDIATLPAEVDVVISHTCPNAWLHTVLRNDPRKTHDPSNEALQIVLETCPPKLWFHGHWHVYMSGVDNEYTRWYSLDRDTWPGFWVTFHTEDLIDGSWVANITQW